MKSETRTEDQLVNGKKGAMVKVPRLSYNQKLASYLARAIFEAPYGFKVGEVQRIAFKGPLVNGVETDMGGFCEGALADCIAAALRGYEP